MGVEWVGRGGVSNVPLMNQCQRSDEKIIKKQACAVLNTAKGKKAHSTVQKHNLDANEELQ